MERLVHGSSWNETCTDSLVTLVNIMVGVEPLFIDIHCRTLGLADRYREGYTPQGETAMGNQG